MKITINVPDYEPQDCVDVSEVLLKVADKFENMLETEKLTACILNETININDWAIHIRIHLDPEE